MVRSLTKRLAASSVRAASTSAVGQHVFQDEVSLEIKDGVALMTFIGTSGAFPWGTKREEHRWNPTMVSAVSKALDVVETSEEACTLVVVNEGKFWSNGMDLKYMDSQDSESVRQLTLSTNELMARICCFPLPTVGAFCGHWCAAGGMMGLAFDYRVMSNDRGFFFVPGVDLGLIYAPMQTALMKAKLPTSMHRDVILFNARKWNAQDLLQQGAIDALAPSGEVLGKALEMAKQLQSKGQDSARKALQGLKKGLYKEVLEACEQGGDMGYVGRVKGIDRAAPITASKL